ncbi:iron-containing alcohol dehydrogenase [Clostridium sp.]|uniref:iron-containing alcohol dehydrogenase n=1 Tax=Clostridium sp. TaxID=1506 RepID=UPI001A477812|nr:iron-containing alcohol dehydrogenase [Clostridium sp.]MBK5236453.1 iron-containing alcohol dehydrogenase [Clostridium sp.]
MITSFNVFVPSIMGSGASLQTGIKVRNLGCKKVLVVYDKGLKEVGIADTIVENIQNAGVETVIFDKVLPDPPDTIIEEAAEIAILERVDGIVAVGGGSSMDTAKGINVLINNPPPIMQYFGVQINLNSGLPMVFIPTTSGTGSEVTNMCVISCTSRGNKDSVISQVCVGTLAIIDPDLTLGLPPKMTAATGVDALAHAVESMTGGNSNPLSDALAMQAIRAIVKWLPVAYKDGLNLEAREHMILASMYAGMAFTNGLVHLGHSIGHTLGAHFHIPHGLACAAALPEVIEYTARTEFKKVEMICECLGVHVPEEATTEEIGSMARISLRSFLKLVGIPNMKELGLQLEDVMKVAPLITADGGFALIPYRITNEKVASMLKFAYDA